MLKNFSDEGTGTTESINFPDGVGLYIAMECYRGLNQDRCSSLFKTAKNEKQKSCGKVTYKILP